MKNNVKIRTYYFIGIIVLVIFSLWKIRLGMHSDEVYLIAVGDMISRGNSFFKECWSSLQMSAVFSAPLAYIYEWINGGTDGILLFFRMVSIFIQFLISLYFYIVFSKKYKKEFVLLASVIIFTFVPDCLSFSYKPEMIWFAILEIIYAYRYLESYKNRYLILLGIAISCSVLAYPTTILQFPMWIIILCLERNNILKKIGIITVTCILCAVIFMAIVLSKISLTEFVMYFPAVFSDDNLNTSYLSKLVHPLIKFCCLGIMTYVPMLVFDNIKIVRALREKYRLSVISILLFASLIIQGYIEREGISWHCITYPYSLTLFMVPILWNAIKDKKREDNQIIILFVIPTVVSVICLALASNQGNITSMYGTVISTVALVLLLGNINFEDNRYLLNRENIWIAVTILVSALVIYIPLVYEQESVEVNELGARTIFTERMLVTVGPAKGIYLGKSSYDKYMGIYDVIEEYTTEDDAVYIVDSNRIAPYGYLSLKGEYATFSPQGGRGIDSKRAVEYYENNPLKTPTVIIVNLKQIDGELDEWLKDSEMGRYIENNYTLKESNEQYVIYNLTSWLDGK